MLTPPTTMLRPSDVGNGIREVGEVMGTSALRLAVPVLALVLAIASMCANVRGQSETDSRGSSERETAPQRHEEFERAVKGLRSRRRIADAGAAPRLAGGLRLSFQEEDGAPQAEAEEGAVAEEVDALEQDIESRRLPHFAEIPNRWYRDPWALIPGNVYEINEPGNGLDPYKQNWLKGDFPIDGKNLFFRLTVTNKTFIEARDIPTPRGITGQNFGNAPFYGKGDQQFMSSKTAISFDLFRGQEAFKPVSWRVRITPVFDVTYLKSNELGVVDINVGKGDDRLTTDIALQEALVEIHILDWNSRYDFLSSEIGIFPFRSDFRGFIFDDINRGVRLFGNADENKWQYNLVYFNMLEKDTFSELNTFSDRDQHVFIANVYRQDFLTLGYTISGSIHWNHDNASNEFNDAGFLVRPQPAGFIRRKSLDAIYLGLAGEGKWGRINVTHAFYHVFGEEKNNAIAARDTTINAQFAALEISYDLDWMRFRAYGMYASGDDDPGDGDAEGFDAIFDAPNFAGGEFSLFNRQEIRLLNLALTPRLSFLPDLSTSKTQGQANFVNPGLFLAGGAFDAEITPTWRAQLGANYMRFVHTESLERYLQTEDIDEEIGLEVFFGTTYRPLLNNHILINVGAAVLFPGAGFEKVYQSSQALYSVFFDLTVTY